MSIIRYTPHDHALEADYAPAPSDIRAIITDTLMAGFRPDASKWAMERLHARLKEARLAADAAWQIAEVVFRVQRASAACAVDLERLSADMLAQIVRKVELELRKHHLTLTRQTLAATVEDEAALAQLRRDVERAKLSAQLNAIHAAASPAPAHSAVGSMTPHLDAEQAAARRKQQESHARWIVEDVQAGHVPTDVHTPYHAFAACVFVTAQLDGANAADAAARTREVVLDRLVAGQPMLAGDPERYRAKYDELRARLDALSGTRQTAQVLAAMQRLGATNVHANGNGHGA